jgi:hypothetical protein
MVYMQEEIMVYMQVDYDVQVLFWVSMLKRGALFCKFFFYLFGLIMLC